MEGAQQLSQQSSQPSSQHSSEQSSQSPQRPARLRTVKEALRPITPTKRSSSSTSSPTKSPSKRPHPRRRPGLVLVQCPTCRTRMSTLMLSDHADRCKPPRPKLVKPPQEPPALHLILHAPPVHASFASQPPNPSQNHTFTATINLRFFTPPTNLHLHATTPPPHPVPLLPSNTPGARLPLSLLKSALQKSVRRNRPWPALRIAIVLLRRRAPFELLRRLTIIILEDAILHPAYPFLVFLLAASGKQHVLSYLEILHLLKLVYEVAAVPTSDPLSDLTHQHPPEVKHTPHVVTALHVRASYGGMQCDTDMLHRAANVWLHRSATKKWQSLFDVYDSKTAASQVTAQRVSSWLRPDDPVLRPGDIPLEAWDFHCCSVADEIVEEITNGVLKGKVPRFEKLSRARDIAGVFKGLMWRFWSGVSLKKPLKRIASIADEREAGNGHQNSVYHISPMVVGQAETEEECVWKEELCVPVTKWCKTYRTRYGL